jgi:hypothetical protein
MSANERRGKVCVEQHLKIPLSASAAFFMASLFVSFCTPDKSWSFKVVCVVSH